MELARDLLASRDHANLAPKKKSNFFRLGLAIAPPLPYLGDNADDGRFTNPRLIDMDTNTNSENEQIGPRMRELREHLATSKEIVAISETAQGTPSLWDSAVAGVVALESEANYFDNIRQYDLAEEMRQQAERLRQFSKKEAIYRRD